MHSRDTATHKMTDVISYQALHAESDPETLFSVGLLCLKHNLPAKAHRAFELAYKLQPHEERYCSYYGLTLATVDRNLKPALELCRAAMEKNYMYPDLYRNLGRVYLLAGQREKAYGVFKKGLKLDSSNRNLQADLANMGIRKPPVFPFLSRNNPLNYLAGKLRHLLTRKKQGAKPDVEKIRK